MKFFSRGKSSPKAQTATSASATAIDPALGDSDGLRLRERLKLGNWREAHDFIEQIRDWDDRQFYAGCLTEWPGRPLWLDEWVAQVPASAIPWLIRGVHGVKWAWEARGGGKAETVDDRSWDVFFQRLQRAEEDLYKAAEIEPRDPTPWTSLITAARGLSRGIPETAARLSEAHARHPWHHAAFSTALLTYAKKWAGSHELMFDLAQQVASNAPEGIGVHTLICEAHVERWLYLDRWEKDEPAALAYFQSPRVLKEIREAARRSVWSARFTPSKLSIADHNYFTYCFFRAGDFEAARIELTAMADVVTNLPWGYVTTPVEAYNVIKERILQGN